MIPKSFVEREHAATVRHIDDLERSFGAIAASVDTANTDDEHDPEGSTLAFERAQIVSLLEEARARLAALDDARARIDAGSFGVCVRCSGAIGDERLAARPEVLLCIDCARAPAG